MKDISAPLVCVLVAITLAGCDGGPRINATDELTFKKSMEKIEKSLTPEKLDEFRWALMTVVGEAGRAVTDDPSFTEMNGAQRKAASERAFKKAVHRWTVDQIISKAKSIREENEDD